jgi:hypothetical protein
MTKAQRYLEKPVSFRTAAKKVAKIRGHVGREGGWIYTADGLAICQGWESYAQRCFTAGLIAQDDEHDGDNGKWFVPVLWLRPHELQRAEQLFG